MGDQPLELWYRRYLQCCNEHRFDALGEFVAGDVQVNGEAAELSGYVAGLEAVVRAFPDYRWELRQLLLDGCRLAAHLVDRGTHLGTFLGVPATGKEVVTQEFAFYRIQDEKIAEVWVTADNVRVLEQLRRRR